MAWRRAWRNDPLDPFRQPDRPDADCRDRARASAASPSTTASNRFGGCFPRRRLSRTRAVFVSWSRERSPRSSRPLAAPRAADRRRGHRLPGSRLARASQDPGGRNPELCPDRGRDRPAQGGARGRDGKWRQPCRGAYSVPSGDPQRRLARRLCRRSRSQAPVACRRGPCRSGTRSCRSPTNRLHRAPRCLYPKARGWATATSIDGRGRLPAGGSSFPLVAMLLAAAIFIATRERWRACSKPSSGHIRLPDRPSSNAADSSSIATRVLTYKLFIRSARCRAAR